MVGENVEPGIVSLSEGIELAEEFGLDLVEISPKADPPVCRIVDYNKFLYEQKKKAKEIKANSSRVEIKEIRFGPNTDEHDIEFKTKHATKLLSEGHKVRAYVFYRGRTIVYKERGSKLLEEFAANLFSFSICFFSLSFDPSLSPEILLSLIFLRSYSSL